MKVKALILIMKMKLSLIGLLLLVSCSLSCAPPTLAIEKIKSKNMYNLSTVNANIKEKLEIIVKANPEVVDLKFHQLIDYESSDPGRGYLALWKTKYGFFEIHTLTFGRRDIAPSFNATDARQYIGEKSLTILSFLQKVQRERDNNMQDGGLCILKIGKYNFLSRPLKYSILGKPINSVILSTSLNGKVFGFHTFVEGKSEDEAKIIIESVTKEIPSLLNSLK